MDSNEQPSTPKNEKPYVKPVLQRVMLRPEEAVLQGCKFPQTPGPAGSCVPKLCHLPRT